MAANKRILAYRSGSPRARKSRQRVQRIVTVGLLSLLAGAAGFWLGALALHEYAGGILGLAAAVAVPVALIVRDALWWPVLALVAVLALALLVATHVLVTKTMVVRNESRDALTEFQITTDAGGAVVMYGTLRPGAERRVRFSDLSFRGRVTVLYQLDDARSGEEPEWHSSAPGFVPWSADNITIRITESGNVQLRYH